MQKGITTRQEDYNQWYQDVIAEAELAENSVVRGCMVIKPHGFAIWENIQHELDRRIKETGHKNLYFPIFVPKSTMEKEATHVEGFAKESAIVTHHRLIATENGLEVDPESKLEEEVIVRPTSEAVMYETFAKWIQSWRDLPLLVNQWANVVRWEMRTRLFLRTAEFLWQEGHTVHATFDEAQEETLKMLNVYKDFVEEFLALTPVAGKKSKAETFPGAHTTYTLESLMQDGKALQAGTSHNLGDNFSKAFNIQFTNESGELEHAWQTSWGFSTRIIGALIMTHSDDQGLVLPPQIAPIQVVVVSIWNDDTKEKVLSFAQELVTTLSKAGFRVEYDTRDYISVGRKFNEWEKKGVCLRVEVGASEIEKNVVKIVNRLTGNAEEVATDAVVERIEKMLEQMQTALKANSERFLQENTHEVSTYKEFKQVLEEKRGFIKAFWCENAECEAKIKEETKATTRCLPLDAQEEDGKCVYCGTPAKNKWLFAVAY